MCIDHATNWWEIKELQAHGEDNPSHDQPRPSGPRLLNLSVLHDAEVAPHEILNNTRCHVGGHVVGVVPAPKGQIDHVGSVQQTAGDRPDSQDALLRGLVLIETEDSDWREVQAIEHTGSRSKVVELLSDVEVSSVKDHAKDPTGQTKVSKK